LLCRQREKSRRENVCALPCRSQQISNVVSRLPYDMLPHFSQCGLSLRQKPSKRHFSQLQLHGPALETGVHRGCVKQWVIRPADCGENGSYFRTGSWEGKYRPPRSGTDDKASRTSVRFVCFETLPQARCYCHATYDSSALPQQPAQWQKVHDSAGNIPKQELRFHWDKAALPQ